jgi:hypothetical protein
MSDLMQKLAISKKIMDKHSQTPRRQVSGNSPMNENITAEYNIPEEMLLQPQQQPRIQKSNTNTQPVSEDAIKKSKLPDEIKMLMLENPIVLPQMSEPVLSDEIIEGATRLMGTSKPQQPNQGQPQRQTVSENSDLKQMIRDVVRDTVRDVVKEELQRAGLLTESTQNTNETLSLRVGKHIFEGKVLKIRKVKQ